VLGVSLGDYGRAGPEHGDRAPSNRTAERIIAAYRLAEPNADRLRAIARQAGYSSPYITGRTNVAQTLAEA
jgi:hypothetical protein